MTLRVVAGWWARRGTHLPVAAAIAVVTAATVLADAGGRPALLVPLVVLAAGVLPGAGLALGAARRQEAALLRLHGRRGVRWVTALVTEPMLTARPRRRGGRCGAAGPRRRGRVPGAGRRGVAPRLGHGRHRDGGRAARTADRAAPPRRCRTGAPRQRPRRPRARGRRGGRGRRAAPPLLDRPRRVGLHRPRGRGPRRGSAGDRGGPAGREPARPASRPRAVARRPPPRAAAGRDRSPRPGRLGRAPRLRRQHGAGRPRLDARHLARDVRDAPGGVVRRPCRRPARGDPRGRPGRPVADGGDPGPRGRPADLASGLPRHRPLRAGRR